MAEENKAGIELWDLDLFSKIASYSGHAQEKYVLRPIFGGKFEKYIA